MYMPRGGDVSRNNNKKEWQTERYRSTTLGTMRLSIQAFLAAVSVVAASAAFVEASIALSSISGASRWSLAKRNASAFGLAKSIATLTRGGAEVEEPEVAAPPDADEVLYLPGLLDVSIVKTSKVG